MHSLNLKKLLIGNPLDTAQQATERLTKAKALAVFSSDALSSVAYATEEILLILMLAGSVAVGLSWPISLAIAALIAIVITSYYQTVHAYPSGGGSYIVAHDNLGVVPGLVAAAALTTDYFLTVAVSTTAGVAAITSAMPELYPYRIWIAVASITLITIANLRGVRESGTIFAIPSYIFVFAFLSMIAIGIYRWVATGAPPAMAPQHLPVITTELTLFLVLRAFAAGCTALTGIEAISNGVQAFKPPESDNAGKTLIILGSLSVTMFVGVTFVAHQFGIVPIEATHETVVSLVARTVLGDGSPFYFLVQITTMLILMLAANTSFNGFPRLASILARDRYMPRQFSLLGDRLVFSNGIIVLGLGSILLVAAFGGETTRLIPLYAVGVFVSFTLSQTGMVMRWVRRRDERWILKASLNGVGALATGIVSLVIAVTKFAYGAWAVLLLIPLLVAGFRAVERHYVSTADQLSVYRTGTAPRVRRHRVILPIAGVHAGVLRALEYARSISDDVTAVHVAVDPAETDRVRARWDEWGQGVRLEVLESPYRSIIGPLMQYVNQVDDVRRFDEVVTIVLPQFITERWWTNLLHNQTAFLIRLAFLFRSNTIVTDVPYRLH